MPDQRLPQPGDEFLDRYLPGADEETRERAREALRRYVLHLIAIGGRIRREREAAADSTETSGRPTIPAPSDL